MGTSSKDIDTQGLRKIVLSPVKAGSESGDLRLGTKSLKFNVLGKVTDSQKPFKYHFQSMDYQVMNAKTIALRYRVLRSRLLRNGTQLKPSFVPKVVCVKEHMRETF